MSLKNIIAITGSSGKTTTKEMLASILQTQYKTFKSIANGNDAWYTSLYKKTIESSDHEAVVLEYGLRKNKLIEVYKLTEESIEGEPGMEYVLVTTEQRTSGKWKKTEKKYKASEYYK